MITPSQDTGPVAQVALSVGQVEVLSDLTSREEDLVRAAHRGHALSCGDMAMEDLAGTDDPRFVVRAELIRELLVGRRGVLDPRGIRLEQARIVGTLDLNHCYAQAPLVLHKCVLDGALLVEAAQLPHLDLSGTHMSSLQGHGLQVNGGLVLGDGYRATGSGRHGAVCLVDAHIRGRLMMSGAHLTNDKGAALDAKGLEVDGDLHFVNGCRASGSGHPGTLRLIRAHIHGHLVMTDAELTYDTGPALFADGLQVDDGLFIRDGFRAFGSAEHGAVRLPGAHIHGPLHMRGAKLTNDTGPALSGHSLRVDGGVFLDDGFRATGAGNKGTVFLYGAHIDVAFDMSGGTELTNGTGPALSAYRLQTDGDVLLNDGFRATGSSDQATIGLSGAQIRGCLDLSNAVVENQNGSGLIGDLEDTTLESALRIPADLICRTTATTVTACADTHRRIDVDNLTYGAFSLITWRQWLHVLSHHTNAYSAQPYQQLAAVQRAAGHDGPARAVLIAQQDDLRNRGEIGGRTARVVHAAWGKLAGYGYRPARLLIALAVVIAVAGGLGVLAGHIPIRDGRTVAAHTERAEHPRTPCSLVERLGLGIDRGLPLGTTGMRERCDLDTTSHRGQALTIALWLVQALIWALATLAVAGYTGLIRKIT